MTGEKMPDKFTCDGNWNNYKNVCKLYFVNEKVLFWLLRGVVRPFARLSVSQSYTQLLRQLKLPWHLPASRSKTKFRKNSNHLNNRAWHVNVLTYVYTYKQHFDTVMQQPIRIRTKRSTWSIRSYYKRSEQECSPQQYHLPPGEV